MALLDPMSAGDALLLDVQVGRLPKPVFRPSAQLWRHTSGLGDQRNPAHNVKRVSQIQGQEDLNKSTRARASCRLFRVQGYPKPLAPPTPDHPCWRRVLPWPARPTPDVFHRSLDGAADGHPDEPRILRQRFGGLRSLDIAHRLAIGDYDDLMARHNRCAADSRRGPNTTSGATALRLHTHTPRFRSDAAPLTRPSRTARAPLATGSCAACAQLACRSRATCAQLGSPLGRLSVAQ